MADDDPGLAVRLALTLLVIVFAVPGLIIEPGPISELLALGAVGTIWGVDLPGGGDGGG